MSQNCSDYCKIANFTLQREDFPEKGLIIERFQCKHNENVTHLCERQIEISSPRHDENSSPERDTTPPPKREQTQSRGGHNPKTMSNNHDSRQKNRTLPTSRNSTNHDQNLHARKLNSTKTSYNQQTSNGYPHRSSLNNHNQHSNNSNNNLNRRSSGRSRFENESKRHHMNYPPPDLGIFHV